MLIHSQENFLHTYVVYFWKRYVIVVSDVTLKISDSEFVLVDGSFLTLRNGMSQKKVYFFTDSDVFTLAFYL